MMYLLKVLTVVFQLGMSLKQAQAACPHALMPVYKNLGQDKYLACDDGTKTTVLIFVNNKIVAIYDLLYFVKQQGG